MGIKNYIRKKLLGYRADSESYIAHLRAQGMRIGERVRVFEANKTFIDETRPFLIEIGDDVQITRGVTILTHGYDWSVLKGIYGEVLGSAGRVKIGNNVFIDMNTMILKGITIGNNDELSMAQFQASKPMFEDFGAFLTYMRENNP